MSSPRQFYREISTGSINVEGRQSNGFAADSDGNVFFYSGLKDSELEDLTKTNYDDNIPYYYGNSYIVVAKSKTHNTLRLGNEKWDLDEVEDKDPNKIVQVTDDKLSGVYKPLQYLSAATQNLIVNGNGLVLVREVSDSVRVQGTMWYKGKVLGFTCEDPERLIKIASKTCIPIGHYIIKLGGTGEPLLYRYLVNIPGEGKVFARVFDKRDQSVGEIVKDKNGNVIKNTYFTGIRIHGGWGEDWSAGCIIYSPIRYPNGKVGRAKIDYWEEFNAKLTWLIHDNKIDKLDVVHELGDAPRVPYTEEGFKEQPKQPTPTLNKPTINNLRSLF